MATTKVRIPAMEAVMERGESVWYSYVIFLSFPFLVGFSWYLFGSLREKGRQV